MRRQPSSALVEMLAQDQANGVNVFDDPTPRPTPGPPEHHAPLQQPVIPAPDWRAEEVAAARTNAEPDPEPPPPESLDSRPAKPRKKTATPNLDKVRSWMGR